MNESEASSRIVRSSLMPTSGIAIQYHQCILSAEFRPVVRNRKPEPGLQEFVRAMTDSNRHLLICSCEGTIPLDADAVRRGCRDDPTTATQLCHAERDKFRAIAAKDTPLTVGCTQ